MLKKWLSLSSIASAIVVTAGLAGGPKLPPPVPCLPAIYIEGNIGYEFTAWDDEINLLSFRKPKNMIPRISASGELIAVHHGKGGFAWGGALGYQINPFFAVEIGAYNLQSVHANAYDPRVFTLSHRIKLRNWLGYAAGKLLLPIIFFDGLDLFVKGGIAYRDGQFRDDSYDTVTGVFRGRETSSYSGFRPIIGAGAQYHLTQNWIINAQYLYIPDGNSRTQYDLVETQYLTAPQTHIITGGIGYLFCS